MFKSHMLLAASFAAILAVSSPSLAQTQSDPHHPQQGAATTQTQSMPGAQPQSGMMMPMGEMMQMMGQMMQMMGGQPGSAQLGMGGMGTAAPGAAGMGMAGTGMASMGMGGMGRGSSGTGGMGTAGMGMPMIGLADHLEGRIAFLRAELNITKAQEKAWNDFAAALHEAGQRFKEQNAPAMPGMASSDLSAQLDAQEKLLGARLDGIRAIKAALVPFYAALTDDQRKLANSLLLSPMGFMGPGMMPGGMAAGSTMPTQQ